MARTHLRELRDTFGGQAGLVLVVISAMWMLTIGARIVYPAVMPGIQGEFGFEYSTVGLLVGAVWGAYGLMQFPGGLLADIRTDRLAILVGMGTTMLGLALILVGNSFLLLVVATIVLGAGTGILGPSRVIVLANEIPEAKATAVSISQAAGTLGNAIFPVIAGLIMGVLGWRAGLGFLLPLALVVTVGLWAIVPQRTGNSESQSITKTVGNAARALTGRTAVLGTLVMLGVMLVYQSLTGFLPTYLTDVVGVSPQRATVLFGMFFAAGFVMNIAAGILGDRIGSGQTVGVFALLSIPGLVLVLTANSTVGLVGGVVLSSALIGCFPPGLTYLASVFPATVQGTGFGVIRTVYIGGGALGPVGVGAIADTYSLWTGFVGLVVVLGCITILVALLPPLSAVSSTDNQQQDTRSSPMD